MEINIREDLLKNEVELAEVNRSLFKEKSLMVVNLLAAPGSGKTSFIMQTARLLKFPIAVIEADPASSIDTDFFNSSGISAYQINTEGGCHLEAPMVAKALDEFQIAPRTLVFIENVGNLICTACYPLGEALRVVMTGVSEGDDKPFKYPDIFQTADVLILNKTDLKPLVDFNSERFYKGVRILNPKLPVFEISCKSGDGLEAWVNWLTTQITTFWTGE